MSRHFAFDIFDIFVVFRLVATTLILTLIQPFANTHTRIKEPKNSKLDRIKSVLAKLAATTTVYGLTRALKADTAFMKFTWSLMTLASLSFGLHIILNTIAYYLKHDVLTHTKRHQSTASILPTVIFCHNGIFMEPSRLFTTAVFRTKNSSHTLIADTFEPNPDLGLTNCIKFNYFQKRVHDSS